MALEKSQFFRTATLAAGIALTFLGLVPSGETSRIWFVMGMALPMLALPLLPKARGALFAASFLIGYTTILGAALWLLTLVSLPFSFERVGAVTGAMAVAVSAVWVVALIALIGTQRNERVAIPGGVILGMLYFPVVWFAFGAYQERLRGTFHNPQDLYHPVACSLAYQTSYDHWAQDWASIARQVGCGTLPDGMTYQRTSTGFQIRTTGPEPQYYSDESGIVRRNDHSGSLDLIMSDDATSLGRVLLQLEEFRHQKGRYPESFEALIGFMPSFGKLEKDHHYVFSYKRETPDRFTLSVRPTDYGVSGVRSFYTDQSHIVHGTPLNREASPTDPIAPNQEIRDPTPHQ